MIEWWISGSEVEILSAVEDAVEDTVEATVEATVEDVVEMRWR